MARLAFNLASSRRTFLWGHPSESSSNLSLWCNAFSLTLSFPPCIWPVGLMLISSSPREFKSIKVGAAGQLQVAVGQLGTMQKLIRHRTRMEAANCLMLPLVHTPRKSRQDQASFSQQRFKDGLLTTSVCCRENCFAYLITLLSEPAFS